MSLCINPRCLQPNHPGNDGSQFCQSCGTELLLQGRYRVMRLMSDKSGFGLVYEAFERSTPKILKVLKPDYSQNSKAIALFKQEALVLSQLSHPGIPAIEPTGYFQVSPPQVPELYCIIMEKIDGPNLREWMRQQGNHTIGQEQAINWLLQLTRILHLVHQKNYFHRDIKPENIMLRSTGQLVLVDFGAAREMTVTYLEQVNKTGGITRISSAGYTPPEQERGQAVPQSDFYALGCTFLYLLTGKQPMEPDLYDALNNTFRWREFASPNLFPPLADLIDRLTAARAGDRPQDTHQLLTLLADINTQLHHPHPTQLEQATVRPPAVTQVQPLCRRRGAQVAATGIALLLVGLGGYGWHALQSLPSPSSPSPLPSSPSPAAISTVRQGLKTLQGHTSFVNCLAISPDGRTLISGSADQTIKIWDWATGRLQRSLSDHRSFVNVLAVSPDGRSLMSGSADQTIKIWDLATGTVLHTLTGHQGYINALEISPDGRTLVSGGADQTIKVWDMATGRAIRTLTGHLGYVNGLAISPDGRTLVSGSADKTIKVWDLATGKELHTLTGHTSFVNAVAISVDGHTLVSSSADKTIKVWDLATGDLLRTLTGHTSFVNPIAFSPDGQTLISGGGDRTIRVWDLATGTLRRTITGYGGEINYFVITPDWEVIATGSNRKDIEVWKLEK